MRQVLTKKEYLGNLLAFSGGSYTSAEPAERHSVKEKPIVRNQEAMEHKRQKTQKIVVLGGSFNPPTLAHEKLLIEADKLKVIPRWHQRKQFFETFDFAVVCRNGTNPSDAIRKNSFLNAYEDIFHLIAEPEGISEISSTLVRNLLQKGDRTAETLLSANVYEEVFQMLQQKDIDSFRGDYDFLSNFYEAVINYQGIQYLNNESAFQAQKCLDESEKIEFSCLSAAKAKRKGRQIALRPDWEQVKVPIMEEIVRAKFSQNPQLAAKLIATADRKIVEGNTWNDTFWGVDVATGKGENHLGEILMKIREELINGK